MALALIACAQGEDRPLWSFWRRFRGDSPAFVAAPIPLIPEDDRRVIESSLKKNSAMHQRFRYLELNGADHGFMCEERSSFNPEASSQGWQILLAG